MIGLAIALGVGLVVGIALGDRGVDVKRATRIVDDVRRIAELVPDPHARALGVLIAELETAIGIDVMAPRRPPSD